ncbi:MAG: STN domain-containing protein [Proteobacteria bacterium]|nr:STN domain-containing protein [Pseudomonadota bacterium]
MNAAYTQRDVRGTCCFVAMCLAWTLQGRANHEEMPATKLELRIAAQPLDEALDAFALQSGVQVIYFSHLTEGMQSPGVRGSYTVSEALEALLKGSGLSCQMLNADTVVIRKADAGAVRQ